MNKPLYELAELDYINGMKYKEIAEKYNTTINTVKSWKTRYKWSRQKGKHSNSKVSMHSICYRCEIKEIWKDINGYEGLYQVSTLGNFKSLGNNQNKKEKMLKLVKNDKGYLYVHLYKKNIKTTIGAHIIVARTFIPNPNNYPEVNHKNEMKSKNEVSNLEWCTRKYNNMYGTRIQLFFLLIFF